MTNRLAPIAAAVALLAAAPAHAQSAADYPNKPVKVVVTVPAGGGVDTVTRIVTDRLRNVLGQPFVVENKGGAGGNIAAESVFQSAAGRLHADGLAARADHDQCRALQESQLRSDRVRAGRDHVVGAERAAGQGRLSRPRPRQEFMAYVKANPGKLNYASQGPGTTSHLTAELFNKLTGTKLQHVPYKGTGPALNDLVAGHVDLIFMQYEAAIKLHEGGRARILAVTTEKRIAALPDIPTMAELGLKDFVSDTWNAISAPPKTPAPIVAKLNVGHQRRAEDAGGPGAVSQARAPDRRRHAAGHGEDRQGRHRALGRGDQGSQDPAALAQVDGKDGGKATGLVGRVLGCGRRRYLMSGLATSAYNRDRARGDHGHEIRTAQRRQRTRTLYSGPQDRRPERAGRSRHASQTRRIATSSANSAACSARSITMSITTSSKACATSYFYFDPESDGHSRADSATLERAYRDLIIALTGVLHDANFIEVAHEEIERAHRDDALVRVKIHASLDNYREIRFFRRGNHKETVEYPQVVRASQPRGRNSRL